MFSSGAKIGCSIFSVLVALCSAAAEPHALRIGFVGSLSGFAANYGTAVLEGAQTAQDELTSAGVPVEIFIEDDQSNTKNTAIAFQKLVSLNKIQALIGGTWWANGIVRLTEQHEIPFLSCETLFNDDVVLGPRYFLMAGDLRSWVQIFEPMVSAKGWKKGATIRFASGFGATLAREMQNIFSRRGRTYAGTIEYSDILASDASSIGVQLRKLSPDVVYIDAQPGGLANILRKLHEQGLSRKTVVLTNAVAEDMFRGNLVDPAIPGEIYFTKKGTWTQSFLNRFRKKFGRDPMLHADLGYYSLLFLHKAMQSPNPAAAMKSGSIVVDDLKIQFDEHNAFTGISQEIWTYREGTLQRVSSF